MGVAVTFVNDNSTVEVEPGAEAICSVSVQNTGMVVDAILLDVLGEAGQWANVEPAEVNLLPGASATAKITFRPPRLATRAPGEVPFGLRVMSREDPDGSRIEEGVVQVGEFSDLGVSLVPKSATGRRSAHFRLVVENRGNRREDLTVDASDPDLKLAFRARPDSFSASPGTATFVRLTTVPRKTFFKGPNRTLPFAVSALPEQGAPVKTDGMMLEKQILPGWLLPLLGIAVLAAGLILALWLAVLRPVVQSAATAAANAHQAAKSAKSAASAAAKTPPAPPPPSPSALDVTLPAPTIRTRTTELADVTGSFKTGGGALPDLVWTSSAPKIARVSQTGVVTGLRAGSAMITATTVTKARTPSPSPSPSAAGTPVTTGTTGTAGSSRVLSGSATVNVVGPLKISSTALPEAPIGKPYSTSLDAAGGTGAFTWSVSGGSLPPGLSISPGSGAITGTATVLGKSSFTVHLADAGPPTQFTSKTLTIKVVKPLAVDTSSLPGGTVGGAYSQPLAAVGGTPPYSWSISPGTGSLPSGLALDPKTGKISGTPTSAGGSNFTVEVSDAALPSQSSTESLSVSVVNPLALGTLVLPSAVLNSSYSQTLTASGGDQPYSWSVLSGSLPAGLTLNPDSGTLNGTPTATGSSTFTIQVIDTAKPSLADSRTFTVNVVNSFIATTSSLPQGSVGQSYTAQLTASGGVTPYVWTLLGTLPAGLSLSPGGTITGTPTSTGVFPFSAQAVDSTSPPLSVTVSLAITVVSPLRITTSSLPEAVTGGNYNQTISAVGGTQPYTWSVTTGSLPTGLHLDPGTGGISGTPLATGTSNFTISLVDSSTPSAVTASFSTSITVVEPLNFTEPALPDAVVTDEYGPVTPNHVTGGSGSYTWFITNGTLPPGLSIDQNTGTISGEISGSASTGTQNFTLTLSDSNDPAITTSQPESIDVFEPLQAGPLDVSGISGTALSQDLSSEITGGRKPYTFSSEGLDNLSVNSVTGVISGTPDAVCQGVNSSGTDPVVVTCDNDVRTGSVTITDADGDSITANITLTVSINPFKFVPVTSLPDVHDLRGYDQFVTANGAQPTGGFGPAVGGVGGYSFSTSGVSGPTGNNGLPCNLDSCNTGGKLSINSQTGEITGELTAPPASGTWTFDVTIEDTDPLNTTRGIGFTFRLSIHLS